MIIIACVLLYMGIGKKFEPLLLVPIAFGMLLANLPLTGLLNAPVDAFQSRYAVGVLSGRPACDLSVHHLPRHRCHDRLRPADRATPSSLLLGAAAQLGIFYRISAGACCWASPGKVAAAIGIIGGADGPTAILVASQSGSGLSARHRHCGVLVYGAHPAYPAADHASADHQEGARGQDDEQLRPVSKTEKIIFPIAVAIIVILLIPDTAPLIGMLMLGNLLRECGVTDRL